MPIFTLEERKEKEKREVFRNCLLSVGAIHIYPGTIQKFIEHYLVPTNSLVNLSDSTESIKSFEDSDVSTNNIIIQIQILIQLGFRFPTPPALIPLKMIHPVVIRHLK